MMVIYVQKFLDEWKRIYGLNPLHCIVQISLSSFSCACKKKKPFN